MFGTKSIWKLNIQSDSGWYNGNKKSIPLCLKWIIFHILIDSHPNRHCRSVPNQSENCKYNLISVWFNMISKRFLCVHCIIVNNNIPDRIPTRYQCIDIYAYYIYIYMQNRNYLQKTVVYSILEACYKYRKSNFIKYIFRYSTINIDYRCIRLSIFYSADTGTSQTYAVEMS